MPPSDKRKRPSIEELERILALPGEALRIELMPNGEIRTRTAEEWVPVALRMPAEEWDKLPTSTRREVHDEAARFVEQFQKLTADSNNAASAKPLFQSSSFGDGDAKTPRTDDAAHDSRSILGGYSVVTASFARQLERELADAQQRINEWRDLCEKADSVASATKYGFEKAHAVCILKCRDALIAKDLQEAYHWLYTLDSKQVPHDPFKPWADLVALAGDDYAPSNTPPEEKRKNDV